MNAQIRIRRTTKKKTRQPRFNIGILAPNREVLVNYLRNEHTATIVAAVAGKMPCGQEFHLKSIADIPEKSVRCPCGRKNHWIVKYTEERGWPVYWRIIVTSLLAVICAVAIAGELAGWW